MLRTLLISLILVVVPAGASVAQQPFNWTGFYAGVHGGYGWGATKDEEMYCVEGNCDNPGDLFEAKYGLHGAQLGVHVGYDYQLDNDFVVGVVGDAQFMRFGGSGVFDYFDEVDDRWYPGDSRNTSNLAFDFEGSLRVRVGKPIDQFLPYLTAGVAFGHANYTSHRVFPDDSVHDFAGSQGFIGAVVGAGAAYRVTDQVVVFAEALYTMYGSQIVVPTDPTGEVRIRVSPAKATARIGVSFRFD